MTVKMPLLFSFLRSLSAMPDKRLRSSFSIAFCLHRAWNSHSPQCRFRTRSGGLPAESNAAIFPVSLPTRFLKHETVQTRAMDSLTGLEENDRKCLQEALNEVSWQVEQIRKTANHTSEGIRRPADGSPKPSM